ncbi:MAG: YHS domain-containing (seleno)protein [Endozoicomonas sp. (ex Botrylloides leachii)]|nr:YHS domain-containing (seleno)protein [Endozoicomonas sp. (ex Botrylloides leachii)]
MKPNYWNVPLRHLLVALVLLITSTSVMATDRVYTGFFNNKAVSGYDTVAYFTEGKPKKGSDRYTTKYMGAKWLFSSIENLELFKANPKKYAPQYGGYCAWAMAQGHTAKSDPKQWSIENGKLYLNYDASVKKKWLADKEESIKKADQHWSAILK